MGTNYYLRKDAKPPCKCCGRDYPSEELHIGKSSGGWCFSLHVIPEKGINSWLDWTHRFSEAGTSIFDEYGHEITVIAMTDIVFNRGSDAPRPQTAEWYSENHARPGPRGLASSVVDGVHCVGHAECGATFDLIAGDFS